MESNRGEGLVRRITNPIRPDVLGEPANDERSPKPKETIGSLRSMPELKGEYEKSQVGHVRWVGMEWSEGRVYEAGNPAGAKRCPVPNGLKASPGTGQSIRSSQEASNDRGAKGCRKVEA